MTKYIFTCLIFGIIIPFGTWQLYQWNNEMVFDIDNVSCHNRTSDIDCVSDYKCTWCHFNQSLTTVSGINATCIAVSSSNNLPKDTIINCLKYALVDNAQHVTSTANTFHMKNDSSTVNDKSPSAASVVIIISVLLSFLLIVIVWFVYRPFIILTVPMYYNYVLRNIHWYGSYINISMVYGLVLLLLILLFDLFSLSSTTASCHQNYIVSISLCIFKMTTILIFYFI